MTAASYKSEIFYDINIDLTLTSTARIKIYIDFGDSNWFIIEDALVALEITAYRHS